MAFVYEEGKKALCQLKAALGTDGGSLPLFYKDLFVLSKIFKLVADTAGVKCRLHDLRRTSASRIANAGRSLLIASEYIGDKTQTVTRKHYLHLSNDVLCEAGRAGLAHAQSAGG